MSELYIQCLVLCATVHILCTRDHNFNTHKHSKDSKVVYLTFSTTQPFYVLLHTLRCSPGHTYYIHKSIKHILITHAYLQNTRNNVLVCRFGAVISPGCYIWCLCHAAHGRGPCYRTSACSLAATHPQCSLLQS